jgi:hypothetical protein
MRVDVERDYLHHRYQILVVIPDDELVAMDPTAYDLVRRSILATEPMAVRDMVAILQIAAEWLQRHPEAEYAPETERPPGIYAQATPESIAWNQPSASSLPAPFAFNDDMDPKESRARVTWLDRWLKRRAAKP